MYRKIRLIVDSQNLSLLQEQLRLIGILRDCLVEHLLSHVQDWNQLVQNYKLIGQVHRLLPDHPELGPVPVPVLIQYALDLCTAGQAPGFDQARPARLYQHRPSLIYRQAGFEIEDDRLILDLRQGTLDLGLASCLDYRVQRVRVYQWDKDARYYGTFTRALEKPDQTEGLPEKRSFAAAEVDAQRPRSYDLATLRTRWWVQETTELRKQIHQRLQESAVQNTRCYQLLLERLENQQNQIQALRADLERQRTLPWLN